MFPFISQSTVNVRFKKEDDLMFPFIFHYNEYNIKYSWLGLQLSMSFFFKKL